MDKYVFISNPLPMGDWCTRRFKVDQLDSEQSSGTQFSSVILKTRQALLFICTTCWLAGSMCLLLPDAVISQWLTLIDTGVILTKKKGFFVAKECRRLAFLLNYR